MIKSHTWITFLLVTWLKSINQTKFFVIQKSLNHKKGKLKKTIHFDKKAFTDMPFQYWVHWWKYFYHRSKFGSKNPKLISNNPFILNLNFKNHLDLACQFLDWQGSELLDKGSNNRIPNSKYMTILALIR